MYTAILLAVLTFLVPCFQAQQRPDPCCFPERWQAGIRQHLFYSRRDAMQYGITDAYLEYSYDYPNKRLAARMHTERPEHYERFLLNFNDGRIYFIGIESCKYRNFREHHEFSRSCIPDSASYQGNFFMGLNKVTYNRWFIFQEGREATVDVSDMCVPGFSRARHENERYVTHIDRIYFNVTTTLTDESIFDVPDNCEEIRDREFYEESNAGITRMHAYQSLLPIPFHKEESKPHLNPKLKLSKK